MTDYSTIAINRTSIDKNLLDDIADDADACTEYLAFEGNAQTDAPNATIHIMWFADIGRAGLVYVGSGSSGHTVWTDAESPEDALRRYFEDDLRV